MNEQVPSPEALSTKQENALICEMLLGFKKHCDEPDCLDWRTADGKRYWKSPSFTTWADAGLILDAFKAKDCIVSLQFAGKGGYCAVNDVSANDTPLPLAIRAAALKYIRSLP